MEDSSPLLHLQMLDYARVGCGLHQLLSTFKWKDNI